MTILCYNVLCNCIIWLVLLSVGELLISFNECSAYCRCSVKWWFIHLWIGCGRSSSCFCTMWYDLSGILKCSVWMLLCRNSVLIMSTISMKFSLQVFILIRKKYIYSNFNSYFRIEHYFYRSSVYLKSYNWNSCLGIPYIWNFKSWINLYLYSGKYKRNVCKIVRTLKYSCWQCFCCK